MQTSPFEDWRIPTYVPPMPAASPTSISGESGSAITHLTCCALPQRSDGSLKEGSESWHSIFAVERLVGGQQMRRLRSRIIHAQRACMHVPSPQHVHTAHTLSTRNACTQHTTCPIIHTARAHSAHSAHTQHSAHSALSMRTQYTQHVHSAHSAHTTAHLDPKRTPECESRQLHCDSCVCWPERH